MYYAAGPGTERDTNGRVPGGPLFPRRGRLARCVVVVNADLALWALTGKGVRAGGMRAWQSMVIDLHWLVLEVGLNSMIA